LGAGPYGLSAAAHLGAADGLDIRVFGEPMSFWEKHMPKGMLLRSPLAGSQLSDPVRALTLQAYAGTSGNHISYPLPLDRFIDYGRWFRSRAVPNLDSRKVARVEKNGSGLQLRLEDGEIWKARRVIIAAGIVPFAWRPPEFRNLPQVLASHSCEHSDLSQFAGKKNGGDWSWAERLGVRGIVERDGKRRGSAGPRAECSLAVATKMVSHLPAHRAIVVRASRRGTSGTKSLGGATKCIPASAAIGTRSVGKARHMPRRSSLAEATVPFGSNYHGTGGSFHGSDG